MMTIEERLRNCKTKEYFVGGYRVLTLADSLFTFRKAFGSVVKPMPRLYSHEDSVKGTETLLVILPNECCEDYTEDMINFIVYRELSFYLSSDDDEDRITKEMNADAYALKHTGLSGEIIQKIYETTRNTMNETCGSLFCVWAMHRTKKDLPFRLKALEEKGLLGETQ